MTSYDYNAVRISRNLLKKLFTHIKPDPFSDCWFWYGFKGQKIAYKRIGHQYGKYYVHRLMYALFVGYIDPAFDCDHLCRNTFCVNPAHMDAVTHKENVFRGISMVADNMKKTHCVHGHSLEGCYVVGTRRGGIKRECRECKRLSSEIVNRRIGKKPRRADIKTQCPNGHLYTPDTLILSEGKYHKCRICVRENSRRFRLRQKEPV